MSPVDMKLEIVIVPVSAVDRAKGFYGRLGWRLDADFDDTVRPTRAHSRSALTAHLRPE
ncbi:MAG: hypothetical protein LLG14_08110 [Nocardiaceae bacterium]|nr:hypothetical protein [Nocardiaceae bacterium]